MLYEGKAETVPRIKQSSMIEAMTPDILSSMSSPRILNTHFLFRNLPLDMVKRKTKIVLLHRYMFVFRENTYIYDYCVKRKGAGLGGSVG